MAQGKGRLNGKAKESGGRKKTGTMRKGKMNIPPKQISKVREVSHRKSLSSKINDSIEKQMVAAASSGKLTIMKNKGEIEAGAGKGKGKGKA